jgi:hypothetical protein
MKLLSVSMEALLTAIVLILPDLMPFTPEPVTLIEFSPLQTGTLRKSREQKAASP